MRHAYSDLAVAQMVEVEWLTPEILAFHAQQAAEKALKALLVQHQFEFPRVRAINALLNMCKEAGYDGTESLAEAGTLTRYSVTTRYPGEEESLSRQEAREVFELASLVISWVKNQLE